MSPKVLSPSNLTPKYSECQEAFGSWAGALERETLQGASQRESCMGRMRDIGWLTADHQLILLIGNYMNGTGVKGGAFGFRVSSINKVRWVT